MGVPAFFRWLSRKYPSIVVHCVEDKGKVLNGVKIPVDSSKPNPNNVEFDNLYLDMNGIIHPCCHPENKPAPKNEEEMMIAIFEYIDRIFAIVRPRRLLYMAIDGVAPRAKMNQQRSRRFRASKESVEKTVEISRIREELADRGINLPPEKPKEEHFDSNCITPGTPFMDRLAKCLHYYIHDRLNNDPGWRQIEVVLSDANVPGEGEHKIMDYIRRQRSCPSHDPNTRHCLLGADADLIMLGLSTHEPNFTIMREEFKPNQPRPCEICAQLGHEMKECTGAAKEKQGQFDELEKPLECEVEFIFIRLNVLREYLQRELEMPGLPFKYDFERAVDDWLFMCFFVGNDFLPHLPSLEIREGAIDRLVRLYKDAIYKTGGYLTDSGQVSLERVQLIMTGLGKVEDEIFKRRQESELIFRARQKDRNKRMRMSNDRPKWTPGGQFKPQMVGNSPSPIQNPRQEAYQMRMMSTSSQDKAKEGLHAMMKPENSSEDKTDSKKRKHEDDESEEEPADDVRLWEDGWKDRYYEVKFEVAKDNFAFRHTVAAAYVEGLCWVLRYYFQGCSTWNWYFPYHYAPFASDFLNIGDLNIQFQKGTKPFNPLEQLMGVFPAASRQHVPEPWGRLMTDSESPIIDFYPIDFKVDLNGKKFAWQGVALLPHVDEKRLLKALASVYPLLTADEKRRNVQGKNKLYVRQSHLGYDYLLGLYDNVRNKTEEVDMNPNLFFGMSGKMLLADDVIGLNETIMSPLGALPHIPKNMAICISYIDPQYPEDFIFPARRLKEAVDPPKVLKPGDMGNGRNWRPQAGMAPARQRAFMSDPGHRMLNHGLNSNYNEVPPPNTSNQRRGGGGYWGPPTSRYSPNSGYGAQQSSSFQSASQYGSYSSSQNRGNSGQWGSSSYQSYGGGGGGGQGTWEAMGSGSGSGYGPDQRSRQSAGSFRESNMRGPPGGQYNRDDPRRLSGDQYGRDDDRRQSRGRQSYPPSGGGASHYSGSYSSSYSSDGRY